jgi:release factor glutamine methyltransferase
MLSVLEVVKKTSEFFAAKGVENPRTQAEHIIGHSLGLKRMQLYLQFERLLSEKELETLRGLVRRRAQREPLAYVLGWTEFHGLRLKTDRRALIPRHETEELVEKTIARLKARETPPLRLLDLGTGSGCIALALATAFPEAVVEAVEASAEALALARENAGSAGLEARLSFVQSRWFDGLDGTGAYDAIVANPPYLTERELTEAEPEVRLHEPKSALVAPEAGMADLKHIIEGAASRLAPGGLLALETGIDQHAALNEFIGSQGFSSVVSEKDLSARDRFLFATRGGSALPG